MTHSGAITSELHFLDRLGQYQEEKPFLCHFSVKHIPGAQLTNLKLSPQVVSINDLRAAPDQISLDSAGFEWATVKTDVDMQELRHSQQSRGDYCRQMEEFLKAHLGASEAFTFQTVVRRAPSALECASQMQDQGHLPEHAGPIQGVHVDISGRTAHKRRQTVLAQRLELGFLEENYAATLANRRFRVVNTWRPLLPIKGWPLALCDYRSLDMNEDVLHIDDVHRDHIEESIQVHFNPGQKWYYLSQQHPDEVLLFQNYDSLNGPFTCHASFPIDREGAKNETRESIECRVLVID